MEAVTDLVATGEVETLVTAGVAKVAVEREVAAKAVVVEKGVVVGAEEVAHFGMLAPDDTHAAFRHQSGLLRRSLWSCCSCSAS